MAPPGTAWAGTAWLGPWWLVYRGPVGPTAAHAHHALQVVLGDALEVHVDGRTWLTPIVIPPHSTHRIVDGAADVVLVYVDGDVARGRFVDDATRWAAVARPESRRAATELALAVCPSQEPTAVESAPVRAARACLADPSDQRSIADLAASIGLSPSRLAHLFTPSVGTPMRSYRRWHRLIAAAELISQGAGLTTAAHGAGFADGSHLARTFRQHFGLSVSELTSGIKFDVG